MQHAPVAEADHLHFDMTRALDVALQIERAVAEGFLGLDGGALESFRQRFRVPRDDHAAPAAARRGLGDHGKADVSAKATASAALASFALPGVIATPAALARRRAASLSPTASMDCELGPTKAMP